MDGTYLAHVSQRQFYCNLPQGSSGFLPANRCRLVSLPTYITTGFFEVQVDILRPSSSSSRRSQVAAVRLCGRYHSLSYKNHAARRKLILNQQNESNYYKRLYHETRAQAHFDLSVISLGSNRLAYNIAHFMQQSCRIVRPCRRNAKHLADCCTMKDGRVGQHSATQK